MDPVSAIAGAIAAGAAVAATEVASLAVKDAYAGIKELIVTKFKRKSALAAIEETPTSPAAREGLTATLKEVGAGEDHQLLMLADKLTAALEALGSENLAPSSVELGDLRGYRNAIVRGISATGNIKIGKVTSESGDAIVENVRAGNPIPKN